MASSTGPGDELECALAYLESHGIGDLVAGFERHVLLVVEELSRPAAALAIALAGGAVSLRELDPAGVSEGTALLVATDRDTALRIGRGTALVDEEYGAGRVRVANATTDDMRLAPALELLLEALAACGFLAREAHETDGAARVDDAR